MAGHAQRTTARKASGEHPHNHNTAGACRRNRGLRRRASVHPFANSRDDVFAEWHYGADVMSFSYYPDNAGMSLQITHNWLDGKHRPLTREWRTKVLRQLGFRVLRWVRNEWGEQAYFAKS